VQDFGRQTTKILHRSWGTRRHRSNPSDERESPCICGGVITTQYSEATRLMSSQDGMATVSQLASCGLSRAAVRVRVDRGEWERLAFGVVGHAGLAMSWRRRCRLALLMAGPQAALGAATAARLHQLDGYDRDERIIVCFPGALRPGVLPTGVTGHTVGWLSAKQCTNVDALHV
jgi:hypothetical protein